MTHIHRYVKNRYTVFALCCLLIVGALDSFFVKVESIASSFSPFLFPILTIFLLVFHFFIAFFMLMKYWCDRNRLYLVAIAMAFAGSSLLMVGTLQSYPSWLTLYQFDAVNYNDAMIFFTFRHVMMAILFMISALLYTLRHRRLKRYINFIAVATMVIFTAAMLIFAWLYSSHSPLLSIDLVDNENRQFMLLWHNSINIILIVLWLVTLLIMAIVSRLRNLFWLSGNFLCFCYLVTLIMLFYANQTEGFEWYRARVLEVTATLLIIFVLLCDVFNLYRESNVKYQHSYQNSIRDALTRLYNRSYFYDALNQSLRTASIKPVSVIVSDLDRFKRINDTYGHLQGDKVLQFVARLLMNSVRPQDIAARIGGEEFVLLLTNTPAEAAKDVAERIRLTLSHFDTDSSNGELPEPITISMGVYTATSSSMKAEECVENADKAMYQAKETGRNRVVVYQ